MTTITSLLQRNEAVAASHVPLPTVTELSANGAPDIHTFVVTCCDPRCVPESYFNIKPGEVGVHRNAGGNIRHALRDIIILDAMFTLNEIAIIHHTDCGTLLFSEDTIKDGLKARVDKSKWAEVDGMVFGANKEIAQSVRGDLEWVWDSPFIRQELKEATRGFVFDIKTGKVEEVSLA